MDASDPRTDQLAAQYGVDPAVIAQVLAQSPNARITSGLRSPARNAAVKGVPQSPHLKGEAVDFVAGTPEEMQAEAKSFNQPGYREIYEPKGVHSTAPHLHMEKVDPERLHEAKNAPHDTGWALTGMDSDTFARMMASVQDTPLMREAETEYGAQRDINKEIEAQMKRDFPALQALREARIKNLRDRPDLPQLEMQREEKLPPIRDPMQALSQTLPLLALLGGAFNKRYASAAMEAATAAVNAQKAGDYEARNQAHEAFLQDTKRLVQNNSLKVQQYNEAMDRYKDNDLALKAEMEMIAARWDDMAMMSKIHEGNFKNIESLLKVQEQAMMPLSRMLTVANAYAKTNRPEEYADQNGNVVLYDRENKQWTTSTGAPLGYIPKNLVKLGSQPRGGIQMQLLNDFRTQYAATHGGQAPSPDEEENFLTDYGAKQKAKRDFSPGGNIGKKITSFNVAIAHLGVLEQLIDALNNNDLKTANYLGNLYKQETGQPIVAEFNSVKKIVGDELTKAIIGGAGALGDRQEMSAGFDAANSPTALKGVISKYKEMMVGQLEGTKNDFVGQGVGTDEQFNSRLMPETKRALGIMTIPPAKIQEYNALPPNRKEAAKAYMKSKGYDVSVLH